MNSLPCRESRPGSIVVQALSVFSFTLSHYRIHTRVSKGEMVATPSLRHPPWARNGQDRQACKPEIAGIVKHV